MKMRKGNVFSCVSLSAYLFTEGVREGGSNMTITNDAFIYLPIPGIVPVWALDLTVHKHPLALVPIFQETFFS